jgi:hypothetical protein
MLKNLVQIIKTAVVCVVAIGFHCVCYAEITTVEIYVDCNENPDIFKIYNYHGSSDTQLSLITKGVRVAEIEELVVDWDEFKSQQSELDLSDPSIIAECVPYVGGEQLFDAYGSAYKTMWPPNNALVCKKGEGISVAMHAPNSADTKKYRYVATLVINKGNKKSAKVDNKSLIDYLKDSMKQLQLSLKENESL